ncbi:phosphopantetheine binding protein [Amycolatopsis sulphurea]|uniref:[acyl-carrier-protein] S-malonyltransferase n=1 Tax=Amycolatopsis sulphurea TaxID=76022 RepID=A0A2A9F901_9PSEU|nr:acyltransferase domain-containing protein [Amycolatopsis sulphurea]PFG47907.1 phosphopantetheine binding protein [Amycolatopsis sulphurea]
MTSRTAVLFPGLGGYAPGALAKLAADHPAVSQTLAPLDEAAREYGHPALTELLTDPDGPEIEDLARTPTRLHLAAFGIGLSVHAVLRAEGFEGDVVLGQSTGEMTALAAAGCLTPYDATRVLCEREAALSEADSGGGLVAVGAGAERADCLRRAIGDWTLSVALVNAPRQTVLAGREHGLAVVEKLARVVGVQATRLPVPHPHHSPLLAAAARRLAETTSSYQLNAPRLAVYSPILRRYLTHAADVRELIVGQLTGPVYFAEAIRALYGSAEVDWFLEVGARSVLTDLAAQSLPAGVRISAALREPVGLDDLLTAVRNPAAVVPPRRHTGPAPAERPPATSADSEDTVTTAPDQPPVPSGNGAGPAVPARPQLTTELRQLFSGALGYPEDVFTDDAHFEADLGITSVRKTELLVKVLDRYDLPTPTSDIRVRDFSTLPKLVDLIYLLAPRPDQTGA